MLQAEFREVAVLAWSGNQASELERERGNSRAVNLAGSREDVAEILEGFARRQNPNPGREISGGYGKREGRLMAEVVGGEGGKFGSSA